MRLLLLLAACVAGGMAGRVTMEGNEDEMDLLTPGPEISWEANWPKSAVRARLGQVSGVGMDASGNGYIFHRGSHPWAENDFNSKNEYTQVKRGAIPEAAIVEVSPSGELVRSLGNNSFFLPHGITVDHEGSIWVTDVARHQVLRFRKGQATPDLVLGEKFVPGSDDKHFCKPTKVAVAKNGDFFVADGYCNARVMKFDKNGKLKKKFGRDSDNDRLPRENELLVVHGLTLDEQNDVLCVADREHHRVQCFRAGLKDNAFTGKYVASVAEEDFGLVMDVAFLPGGRYLLVLSAPDGTGSEDVESRGFVYDTQLGASVDYFTFRPVDDDSMYTWGFGEGHALAVHPDGSSFLVGSLVARCDGPNDQCFGPEGHQVPYNTFKFAVRK